MSARSSAPDARSARRETLLVLLGRADRGVLSRDEARLLRATVEGEFAEGDQARRTAGGQQAATRRAQQRLDAAEQAIREIETERDALARRLVTAEQFASALTDHLPGEAWHLAEAIRALCACEMTPQQALDTTAA